MKLLKKDLLIFFLITGIVVILAIKVCYIVVVLAINAFYMKVKAYGDKGVESDFSKKNEGCTFIGDQEESVRQEAWITASQGELSDAIIVAWKAMEGADAYKVYRSNNFYGPYFPVRHIIGEEKYIDKKADQGRYYWYKVKPLTSVYEGRPTKRAQGWIKPPETSESAHGSGVSGILGDIISLIPHWTGLSFLAQKYQKIMPYPMIIDEYIPTSEEIYEYVERVCATPHRRIG
ncbi:MAG: hypothetical protein GY864_11815, partial [Desulfobacterales bacterium]|nr:hypothetical protein [Desulfobacterales bacterium]